MVIKNKDEMLYVPTKDRLFKTNDLWSNSGIKLNRIHSPPWISTILLFYNTNSNDGGSDDVIATWMRWNEG